MVHPGKDYFDSERLCSVLNLLVSSAVLTVNGERHHFDMIWDYDSLRQHGFFLSAGKYRLQYQPPTNEAKYYWSSVNEYTQSPAAVQGQFERPFPCISQV